MRFLIVAVVLEVGARYVLIVSGFFSSILVKIREVLLFIYIIDFIELSAKFVGLQVYSKCLMLCEKGLQWCILHLVQGNT